MAQRSSAYYSQHREESCDFVQLNAGLGLNDNGKGHLWRNGEAFYLEYYSTQPPLHGHPFRSRFVFGGQTTAYIDEPGRRNDADRVDLGAGSPLQTVFRLADARDTRLVSARGSFTLSERRGDVVTEYHVDPQDFEVTEISVFRTSTPQFPARFELTSCIPSLSPLTELGPPAPPPGARVPQLAPDKVPFPLASTPPELVPSTSWDN